MKCHYLLKNQILLNQQGIEKVENYWIAGLERAVCDTSYLLSDFAFENLGNVDTQQLERIAKIYDNKALEQCIEQIILIIKEESKYA